MHHRNHSSVQEKFEQAETGFYSSPLIFRELNIYRNRGLLVVATANMIRAKVNPEAREMLLGHSICLSDSYYRPDTNEILAEYLKAVDLLTINEENRLRRKVEILEVKADKIAELQQTIDDVKSKLGLP